MFFKKTMNFETDDKALVQQWLPIKDIKKGFIITENTYVGVLRVLPINIHLKAKNEVKRILQSMVGTLNGWQDNMQVLALPRPVDLDGYLRLIESQRKEQTNMIKRKLLSQYLNYTRELVASGEATEQRFYIIVVEPIGKYAFEDLTKKLDFLEESLVEAGLITYKCGDTDLIDLVYTFFSPNTVAFEKYNYRGVYNDYTMMEEFEWLKRLPEKAK